MASPRRRLNFNNVQLSPNRVERYRKIMRAATEFRRLAALDLNSHTSQNRAVAISFMRNVINGSQGNWPALDRAVANLNRVRRIGGGNISPSRRSPARRAATTIQSAFRGLKGRRAANWRRRQVEPRYAPVVVLNPNNMKMIGLPQKKK